MQNMIKFPNLKVSELNKFKECKRRRIKSDFFSQCSLQVCCRAIQCQSVKGTNEFGRNIYHQASLYSTYFDKICNKILMMKCSI